jgi:hypothetical protein
LPQPPSPTTTSFFENCGGSVMLVLFVCVVPYELTVPLLLRSLGVRVGLRTGVIVVAPGAFVLCLRRK